MRLKDRAFYVSAVLLGTTSLAVLHFASQPQLKVTDVRLDNLPMQVESLAGTELHFEESVYAVLNADGNLLRNYASPEGEAVNLYIGYYGTAKGGRATHLPQYCFTGQGWSIEKWDVISLDSGMGRVRVNRMIVKKGESRQLVYFWFQSEGKVMATGWEQNWYKFTHRLENSRNDGAFIRVSLGLAPGKDSAAEERAMRFSQLVMPLVTRYWPVEQPI